MKFFFIWVFTITAKNVSMKLAGFGTCSRSSGMMKHRLTPKSRIAVIFCEIEENRIDRMVFEQFYMIEIFDDANGALQTNLWNFNLFDIFLQIHIDLR